MNKKLTTRFTLLALPLVVAVFVLGPAFAATPAVGARRSPLQNIPVTGTVVGGGTFEGQLDIVSFVPNATGDAILANGMLDGVLRTAGGEQRVTDFFVTGLPVTLGSLDGGSAAHARTCAILNLTLGPLDLNLLGLVVHLNQVHLTIDAQSGPGNLLGNLLCAIVHLLDGGPLPDVLSQIVDLLNRVIDLLG
jgi:hypothetical protein